MAVMPKISEAALEYMRSFDIDTDMVVADSMDAGGYRVFDYVTGAHVARYWPAGFDFERFVSIYYARPNSTLTYDGDTVEEKSLLGPTVFDKPFAVNVREELDAIANMLIEKNKAYGDSALNPTRVFSKASAEEQLLVRIDDKLSRIQRGHGFADDDTVKDLIGYLILLRIARK